MLNTDNLRCLAWLCSDPMRDVVTNAPLNQRTHALRKVQRKGSQASKEASNSGLELRMVTSNNPRKPRMAYVACNGLCSYNDGKTLL